MEPVMFDAQGSSGPSVPEGKNIAGQGDAVQEYRYLMKHFNVDEDNNRAAKAYSKIWTWAKEHAESPDRDSVLFEVMRLNRKLGSPGSGMKGWALMENYVNTWMTEQKKIERSAEAKKKKVGEALLKKYSH